MNLGTLHKNRKTKFRILAYSFLVPILLLAGIVIKINFPNLGFPAIVTTGVLVGLFLQFLVQRFFSDDKFLIDIQYENDQLLLTYTNALAEKDQLIIRSATITDISIRKKHSFFQNINTVTFSSAKNTISFKVMRKDWDSITETLTVFSIANPVVK
jgi:hypothetical protein